MMTLAELLTPDQDLTPDHIRNISKSVFELSGDKKLTRDEQGVLAAATGLLRGLAKIMERRDTKPAAADQPDNLTILDV